MILEQIATAIGPGLTTSFGASGGTAPYVYSVRAGGAGGSINHSTGIYTAPANVNPDPVKAYDIVQAVDANDDIVQAQILVTTPLGLFCDILQNQMGLENGRVYFWDQKVFQPKDNDLYIAVSVPNCLPFGNSKTYNPTVGLKAEACVNMVAVVDVDIISRGPAARDRKEEVLIALNSDYSERQQEANSFYIARLPTPGRFINLSFVDGAAIPYRYKISFNIQYASRGSVQVNYFDQFVDPDVVVNS